MKIKKTLLEDLIKSLYEQEKERFIKIELLNFLKEYKEEDKIRTIIRENINLVLKEFDGKDDEDEEDDDDDEESVFNQAMKSTASGDDIKVMTAYGDASHPFVLALSQSPGQTLCQGRKDIDTAIKVAQAFRVDAVTSVPRVCYAESRQVLAANPLVWEQTLRGRRTHSPQVLRTNLSLSGLGNR